VFEREMAYLLNRFQTLCRMRELTAVVLEGAEKREEDSRVDRSRSDDGQKDESQKLDD
jgi:hypothetical protein